MDSKQSRRQFLTAAAGGTGMAVSGQVGSAQAAARTSSSAGKKPKFELGMASYTLRKFDLEKTLEMTRRVGLKNMPPRCISLLKGK